MRWARCLPGLSIPQSSALPPTCGGRAEPPAPMRIPHFIHAFIRQAVSIVSLAKSRPGRVGWSPVPTLLLLIVWLLAGCITAPDSRIVQRGQTDEFFGSRHDFMLAKVIDDPKYWARLVAMRNARDSQTAMKYWEKLQARRAAIMEALRKGKIRDMDQFRAMMALIAEEEARRAQQKGVNADSFLAQQAAIEEERRRRLMGKSGDMDSFLAQQAAIEEERRRRLMGQSGDMDSFLAQQAAIEEERWRRMQQKGGDYERFNELQGEIADYKERQFWAKEEERKRFERLMAEAAAYEEELRRKYLEEQQRLSRQFTNLSAGDSSETADYVYGDINYFNQLQQLIEEERRQRELSYAEKYGQFQAN